MNLLILIILYFACVNLIAYRAFAHDKRCAIAKTQRTPEASLLFWAAVGGWIGAKIAQHRLRHKTYKQPFGRELNNIGMVQGIVAGTLIVVIATLTFATPDLTKSVLASNVAPQAVQPAAGPLGISLRPPAVRPAAH